MQVPHDYIKDSSEAKFHDYIHYLNVGKQQSWTTALTPVHDYCTDSAFEYSGC